MSPLYKKLDVLKLRDLYWYNMGIICYEYFHNNEFPSKLKSNFCIRSDIMLRNSRSDKNNLDYKPPKLVSSYKKPSIGGSAFWNNLPSQIKDVDSLKIFKDKLKKYFIEKY